MFDRTAALKKLMEAIQGYAAQGMSEERGAKYGAAAPKALEITKIAADAGPNPDGDAPGGPGTDEPIVKDMAKDGDTVPGNQWAQGEPGGHWGASGGGAAEGDDEDIAALLQKALC